MMINQVMLNLMGTVITFQEERALFLRENADKMYNLLPYYLAKIIVEIPLLCVTPMIFSIIVYFKTGLTITAWQFFYYYLTILLAAQCSASFGYLISSIFKSSETAVLASPLLMMPITMFGGLLSNTGTMMEWISWFQYLSPLRYGFEALIRNEFDHREYNTTMILQSLTNNYTMSV